MGLVLTQLPPPTLLPLSMLRLSIAEAFAGLFLSGVSTHTVARRFTASGFVMRDQCILVIPRQPGRQYHRNTDTDGRPTTNHLGRTTTIIRDLRPRSDVSTITSLDTVPFSSARCERLPGLIVRVSENERAPFSIALAHGVRPTHDRRVRDVTNDSKLR
jgi:hypothetical protein